MSRIVDIGVDLGTANVVISAKNGGVVLNEPAVIAINRETHNVLRTGAEAGRMVGRTPSSIVALRPLRDGVISDFELVSSMLRSMIEKVDKKQLFGGPHVVLTVPAGVNAMERHSLIAGLYDAGVRRTHLIEKPLAAALGAGVSIGEAYGRMIVDIGGGMTDIAVTSLGRIVIRNAPPVGGDAMDDAIIRYIRRKHNLLIGEVTAAELKHNIASAVPRTDPISMEVVGRNLITGLPRAMHIDSDELCEAIEDPVQQLVENILSVLENTPAELAADINEEGIMLTGGGAKLTGLSEKITAALKVKCTVADDPQECASRGCAMVLENPRDNSRYLSGKRK